MALQFSSRVTKNLAAQIVAGRGNDTSFPASRLVIAFIKDTINVPSSSTNMFSYLNNCLNFSSFGGTAGAGANVPNVLGYHYLPATNSELALQQNGSIVNYIGPTTITALQSGVIGSIIIYAPNTNLNNTTDPHIETGKAMVSVVDGNDLTAYALPVGTAGSTYTQYSPIWFNGVSLITDSVGLINSTAVAKFTSLQTVQGQPFTLNSIGVKVGSFN